MELLRATVFFRPKTVSKVAIIKTKSATIAFFSSPPFLLLALSFSPFLFLRHCDFGASRAYETCLLTHFHSNDSKFFSVFFTKSARYIYIKIRNRFGTVGNSILSSLL